MVNSCYSQMPLKELKDIMRRSPKLSKFGSHEGGGGGGWYLRMNPKHLNLNNVDLHPCTTQTKITYLPVIIVIFTIVFWIHMSFPIPILVFVCSY